jgi:transmembrane sensor
MSKSRFSLKGEVDTLGRVLRARAEASVWIARLHGPNRSPEMETGFQRWLEERSENREEFEALTEIWDLTVNTGAGAGATRLERWEHTAESRELQELRAPRRHDTPRLRVWAVAALVLVVSGLLALGAYPIWSVPSYSTGVGEQRIVQLPDNTRVSLNSNSLVVISYRKGVRRVRLERGEALFEVARDLRRAFIVTAGDRQIVALGTTFVVRYELGRMAVTLVDGKVAVVDSNTALTARNDNEGPLKDPSDHHVIDAASSSVPAPADAPIVLSPGQRLILSAGNGPKLDTPHIDAVTAWRHGEVMLDDTPLVDAVAEMNRYDQMRVVIDNPAIDHLLVSGLYHTGDNEGFARSIALMYRLQVTESAGQIHLKN